MRYQHSFRYRKLRDSFEEVLKAELSEGQARIYGRSLTVRHAVPAVFEYRESSRPAA